MKNKIAAIAVAIGLVVPSLVVGGNVALAATGRALAKAGLATAASPMPSSSALLGSLATAVLTPAQAVAKAQSEAAANGINSSISVTDRGTGAVIAQTGNSGTQVASESIMKLMLASYYLVLVGGYQHQSASVLSQLSYMIRYSDDATANAYFSSSAVPTIAARYGMGSTINATDRVGHWGAVRITAHDMTTFLYRAAHDPQVGPWLLPVMAQVAPKGSDGFNQAFGMNSLSGTHGSKQGWGGDQFWSAASNVINSVGYTDKYYVAILQNSYSYPDPARATSTFAAHTIQASTKTRPVVVPAPIRDGDFVKAVNSPAVYRVAGGAPIYVSGWAGFGGVKAVRTLTAAQFNALHAVPTDGTYLRATGSGEVYRVAGGAPIYLSTLSGLTGKISIVTVDAAAVAGAGQAGYWQHLRRVPSNGTFLQATVTGEVYEVVGGAPIYVTSWAAFGGLKPAVQVDRIAISQAGQPAKFSHLAFYPANGTFITASGTGQVFQIVSGAPVYVSSWGNFGGIKPTVKVDHGAIDHAGQPGRWAHLRFYVPDGTLISATGSGEVYVMAGGAPVYLSSWAALGGLKPTQRVDSGSISGAGGTGPWSHLLARPVNGTMLRDSSSKAIYRVAGGAPLYISSLAGLAPYPMVVTIDTAAITHGGEAGKWAHLQQRPADGTLVRSVETNRVYRVSSGHASLLASWAAYGGAVQPTVRINQKTLDLAGTGGVYNHLR